MMHTVPPKKRPSSDRNAACAQVQFYADFLSARLAGGCSPALPRPCGADQLASACKDGLALRCSPFACLHSLSRVTGRIQFLCLHIWLAAPRCPGRAAQTSW